MAMTKPKTSKKRKFAVFDIDGTIFRSSLLIEVVDELIRRGLFPKNAEKTYSKAHLDWLNRKDSYGKYISGVVKAFDTHIKGVSEDELLSAANAMMKVHEHRVYRFTRDLVHDLKKRGYFILAISHSPKYIVDPFVKSLGFDKAYGRLLELDKTGRFTGAGILLDLLLDKSKILYRAIEKENLTLKGSIGVGDTESDISFLEIVDRPICFNPSSKLCEEAYRRGWRVVVERKDVIYEINTGDK